MGLDAAKREAGSMKQRNGIEMTACEYKQVSENSKLQHPSSREAPNLKLQNNPDDPSFSFGSLELEHSLELGCWSLKVRFPRHAP